MEVVEPPGKSATHLQIARYNLLNHSVGEQIKWRGEQISGADAILRPFYRTGSGWKRYGSDQQISGATMIDLV